ncbi:MAG: hypothetical protein AB2689_12875 [Candidatus Thiodiazotropha taylori]|nr:hypothetical protein [Candidatus Thiodiazotropha taylori]
MPRIVFFILTLSFSNILLAEVNECIGSIGEIIYTTKSCDELNAEILTDAKLSEHNAKKELENNPYLYKIELGSDSPATLYDKALSVAEIASLKGWKCKSSIKYTDDNTACTDFLRYIVKGSVYNQTLDKFKQLSPDTLKSSKVSISELQTLSREIRKTIRHKQFLLTYLNQL